MTMKSDQTTYIRNAGLCYGNQAWNWQFDSAYKNLSGRHTQHIVSHSGFLLHLSLGFFSCCPILMQPIFTGNCSSYLFLIVRLCSHSLCILQHLAQIQVVHSFPNVYYVMFLLGSWDQDKSWRPEWPGLYQIN
ncbi:uncharacterized protein [Euphorbia lathyris]|uniref:uncharacterized protein n=1 Tax=Euphorbia lathyris TaxID=212925 RepID=UPI003313C834